MAHDEEQLHALAVAIIQDCGEQAYLRASLRAANLHSEGDRRGAEFWARVAVMIAEIQARPPRGQYH
jgi:hypothetical protein